MKNKQYKITKDCFFRCYKSYIDYIGITNIESMYNILVLRKPIYNNLTKVTVIIRNYYTGEDTPNEFSTNVILTNEEVINLINDIREDFKNNHYITYATLNTQNFIQTMQNTNFSLNIKLYSIEEYEEAIKFNSKINCDGTRHKVLAKN